MVSYNGRKGAGIPSSAAVTELLDDKTACINDHVYLLKVRLTMTKLLV
jgi:hypothetical protein